MQWEIQRDKGKSANIFKNHYENEMQVIRQANQDDNNAKQCKKGNIRYERK